MIGVLYTPVGKIVGVLSGSPEALALDFAASEHAGLLLPEGASVSMRTHYIKDGFVHAYPEQPGPAYEFNYASEAWELDLTLLKSQRWAEMKVRRAAEEFGQFTWNGYTFDADATSQSRIQGAVQLALLDSEFGVTWTLADNSELFIAATQFLQIGGALGQHVSLVHGKGQAVRAAIEAATTEAELEAIVWPE